MRKINEFRKCCPVCQGLSVSKTKKFCDFCKASLINIERKVYSSEYNEDTGIFKFEIQTKQ